MKTITNAMKMVQITGVTTVEKITDLLANTRSITINDIKESIVELGAVVPAGRPKKAELAQVLAEVIRAGFEDDKKPCKSCGAMDEVNMHEECDLCACEHSTEYTSATGETLVAEQNKSEEAVTMTTVENVLKEINNENNMKALDKYMEREAKKPTAHVNVPVSAGYENPAIGEMIAKVNAAKDLYLANIGEYGVIVEEIEFYPTEAQLVEDGLSKSEIRRIKDSKKVVREYKLANGNIMRFVGETTVRLPEGFAQIKVWDKNAINKKGTRGASVFVDFVGVDLNTTTRPYNMFKTKLAAGSGLVALSIFEFEDENGAVSPLQSGLPTEKGRDGNRYPIFQTADIRYAKTKDAVEADEPMYHRDNNAQFDAQLSAFIQFYVSEFVQANADNHPGFEKRHCTNMIQFQTRDGIMDDEHMASKKSRVILEQPDVMQLAQVGAMQPSRYCSVNDSWLDEEVVLMINEVDKQDREGVEGYDEDGEYRFQRHDEIKIAGNLVKRNTVIDSAVESKCSACPFYCGNTPKTEAQIAKEKDESDGKWVSPYYREAAKAKAQAVQTLVTMNGVDVWVTQYPYEMLDVADDIKAIRIKSGALTVYGSPNVIEMIDPEYKVPVEEFDARRAEVAKLINQIYYASRYYDKLTEAQHEIILNMEMPEDVTEAEEKRWNKAVAQYVMSIGWATERAAARNIEPFYQSFFAGVTTKKAVFFTPNFESKGAMKVVLNRPVFGMKEIHVEEVMADTLYRAETGQLGWGLGYDDLTPTDFVRYLDESAIEFVYDVILDDVEYAIVGGTAKDKELVAGALQVMLQREINNTWMYGVRRDEKPLDALLELKVSPTVKAYIAEVLGLFK